MSVSTLVFDGDDRILVVERPGDGDSVALGLPGGPVLEQESPRRAAARVLAEQLGLESVCAGRLLAIDDQQQEREEDDHGRGVGVEHVFHVGPLSEEHVGRLRTVTEGGRTVQWLAPGEAARLPQPVGCRVRACVAALRGGSVADLEAGTPHRGSPAGLGPADRARLETSGGLSPAECVAVRPKSLTAAAVLCTDAAGHILIVRPVHRPDGRWLLPGGAVDSDVGETPRQAAARELHEGLGISIRVGPLLACDWIRQPRRPAEVVHVYDGGVLTAQQLAAIRLPTGELGQWRMANGEALAELLVEGLTPRVLACLAARTTAAGAVELVNGRALAEGVAALVYRPGSGELLLYAKDERVRCRRGSWPLIGSAVEGAEFPEEVVVRGLREQVGLRVGQPRLVDRVWDLGGSQQLISVFAVPYDSPPHALLSGPGRRLGFVAPPELGDYPMSPYLRAVIDRWLRGDRAEVTT
ncbi:NUDIX domain-containing protein [Streptomyces spectabilis]|uniref:NUDIX domain-containing protein n=1 Tax=Streptomyces spectabilis TaxID=68270 RepID=UPI001377ACC4|nr:NUDIX domain-containing protein [Streptomyces spectabilis]